MKETVPAALAGERVDRVVAMLTGLARADVAALVKEGHVLVDGRVVTTRSRRLVEGETVDVTVPEVVVTRLAGDSSVDVAVVHEDADVIVVDKPAGLVVHPGAGHATGTLVHGLVARFPDLLEIGAGDPARPGIVHRLDKDTSGLLAVARTATAYDSLVGQLQDRTMSRRYLTLVWGHVEGGEGLVDAPVGRAASDPTRMTVSAGGKQARTRYIVVARYDSPAPTTVLRCSLETGRTHQIRVHLAAINHPVVGDSRYGGKRASIAVPRGFLHAEALAFDHPSSGKRVEFTSALPADLQSVLDSLDAGD
ncbi:MAG: RluA family pseudouridine synthase [Actinobacteria bacterium]|nr:RluA family pseudouridine synthase [Actinomycetota bacterium]